MKMIIPCAMIPSKTRLALLLFILMSSMTGCSITNRHETGLNEYGCDEKADRIMESGDLEQGIKLHREFIRNNPDNAVAWYHLGYAFGLKGMTKEEISCYEKAEALGYKGNGDIYFNLGMAFAQAGKYQKAEQALLKSIAIKPDRFEARVNLARIYIEDLDKPLKARDQLLIVLKADPENEEALELARQLLNQ